VPNEPVFVDTNVFVYALDRSEPVKRQRAIEVIDKHRKRVIVSTQVLIELHAVCTRVLELDRSDAAKAVAAVAAFPVVSADRELILDATALAERRGLSIFDATIIRAAARAGCAELLSEDLSAGQELDGVTVTNPFAA